MTKLPLNSPRLLTLFVAIFSSMGVLSATPANGLTFKAVPPGSPPGSSNFEIEYTLADGIFDTIVSSSRPAPFFIDGEYTTAPGYFSIINAATVVPEVVTDFKISSRSQPWNEKLSLFGITGNRLYLWIIRDTEPRFTDVFQAYITAPVGLPVSACKFQACEMRAKFGSAYMGRPGFDMIQTPVTEPQPVPEPSAAVALGVVSALLLKRRRKTLRAQPVATTAHE